MNQLELNVKHIMEGYFIPSLHNILEKANPTEYARWGGNACRQTAVLGTQLLRQMLPQYEWVAWDGYFSDIVNGQRVKYNHAWIYGVNKEEGKGLLVDLSRNHHERLFLEVRANKYPKNHPSYKHMKLISKDRLDVSELMQEKEFYTGLGGYTLLQKIVTDMVEKGVISQ